MTKPKVYDLRVRMKRKIYPLKVVYAQGFYYSKGRHTAEAFCEDLRTRFQVYAPELAIAHAYAIRGEDRTMAFCDAGPCAFPITYWEV